MRDASFTLWGLHALGLDWEADDFMQFVADLQRNEDGALQIMYGLGGERDLTERVLPGLTGYEGSAPVRVGNGAFLQRQNDVFGAVLDSVYLHTKMGGHIPQRLWSVIQDQARCAANVWQMPDQGIWEARGEPKHYVSSKLMCWVALDRAARLAELEGERARPRSGSEAAEQIRADILEHGVSERGVFRQHYETDALDASTLLIPLVRFLPPDDERVRATVLAIADELTENGFVLRYKVDETDDGLHGEEGTFLICSFWLVSALSEIGETERATTMCERLLSHGSPLGLYAEELDARTGRHARQLPAGVHAPRAAQRGDARDLAGGGRSLGRSAADADADRASQPDGRAAGRPQRQRRRAERLRATAASAPPAPSPRASRRALWRGFQPSSRWAFAVSISTGSRRLSIHCAWAGTIGSRAISSATPSSAAAGIGTLYHPSAAARSLIVSSPGPARL